MGISEISKLCGRLLHTSFDLKIFERLIKSKALRLKIKLHLYLGIYFWIFSLGFLDNLISIISRAIKYHWL